MKKKKLPQPHDLLFAEVFSRKEAAASFIKNFAGRKISLDKLKLETLRLEPTSYVKPDLKRFYSDLVFSCLYGSQPVEISIIKEHKSTRPIDPHFQLLDYISEKWRQEKKEKKKRTPVICILLYHGKQTWHYKSMRAFIPGMDDELACFNPLFDFIPVDLADHTDEFILQLETLFLVNTLLVLKHSGETDYVRQNLGKIFVYVERYVGWAEGEKFIETILVYLTKTTELSLEKILQEAAKTPNLKETIMKGYTLLDLYADERAEERAEEFMEKGIEKGIEQGIEKGQDLKEFTLIKRGHEKGLTPEFIADLGDIPIEKVLRVIAQIETEKNKGKKNGTGHRPNGKK